MASVACERELSAGLAGLSCGSFPQWSIDLFLQDS